MEASQATDNNGLAITPAHPYPLLYCLPTEIIIQICSAVDPVLVSHVSRWLRDIVLGTGPLWSTIEISHPGHLITLEPYLERSGGSPLHLVFDLPAVRPGVEDPTSFSTTSAVAILDTVVPHFSRIKHISLSRFWSRADETTGGEVVQALLAPQLETLSLTLPSYSNSIFSRFSLHCPNLKAAHLYGISALQFDQYIGEARNLLYLNISPTNSFNKPVPFLDIYPLIMKNADSLTSLTLQNMHLAPQNIPQHIVLKNLKKVAVCDHTVIPISDTITAPQLKEIHVQLNLRREIHETHVPLFAAIMGLITRHSSLLEHLAIIKDGADDIPSSGFPCPLAALPRLRKLQIQGDIQLSSFGSFSPGLEVVDIWTDDDVTQWESFVSFVEPISVSLRLLRLGAERHANSIDTTLSLSFPKLEVLVLHGVCSDLFLTQISSMPCLKELKIQLMTYNAPEAEENIIPCERGTLILPALIQLDIPYFPHALLYLLAPKLEILRLNLLNVRGLQAAEVISTFLSRCGLQLTELHMLEYDTYRHPPMSLSISKSVTLPNLRILDQPFPLCITPIIDIITPSLESLTIRFPRINGVFEGINTSRLLDMPHLSQIQKLTIHSYPGDTECSDILWAFDQVETFEIQIEETRWIPPREDFSGTLSQYQSLFDTLGRPRDVVPTLPFPKLRHLHMRVGGKKLWLPFSFIKWLILARLDAVGVTPLAQFTLEFEGDRSLSNISYTNWTKQHTFDADWLSETDWKWLSQNVPEFRCHLIRRYSIPELGSGTPWISPFDILRMRARIFPML